MSRASDRYLARLKSQIAERDAADREGRLTGRIEPSEFAIEIGRGGRQVMPAPRYDGDE